MHVWVLQPSSKKQLHSHFEKTPRGACLGRLGRPIVCSCLVPSCSWSRPLHRGRPSANLEHWQITILGGFRRAKAVVMSSWLGTAGLARTERKLRSFAATVAIITRYGLYTNPRNAWVVAWPLPRITKKCF